MGQRVGFHCGQWLPGEELSLALDDWGSVQGATLVERLRTVAGKPLDVDGHLQRLRESAQTLGIRWPQFLGRELIEECVERNREAHNAKDVAVVILLTPGRSGNGPAGQHPTVILHTIDLHWAALAHWYRHGQALVTAANRNVPGACWSTHLKTRSRLHYFLADQQAATYGEPFAGAAMLSLAGHLTESSVANILVLDGKGLVSPPIGAVLHGLSLRRTLRLAEQLNIPVRFQEVELELARRAQGILLTGTSGCLWPAAQFDDIAFTDPTRNPTFQQLRNAWIEDLGIDYVEQAIQQVSL